MIGEGPPAPTAPLPGPAPAPAPTPTSAAPVAPKGVFQWTFKSFSVKSAGTAGEKATLQQQKEEQQKADLARLHQAKEEWAQRKAEAHMHTHNKRDHAHTRTHTHSHTHAHAHTQQA